MLSVSSHCLNGVALYKKGTVLLQESLLLNLYIFGSLAQLGV